jgi:hypothetical protein
MAARAIPLIALIASFLAGSVRADTPKLPGSGIPVENAVAKSNTVFEGQVTELGDEETTYPYAGHSNLHASVRVLHVLRGQLGAYEVVWIALDRTLHQEPPKVGSSYIFCVTKTHSQTISYPSPVLKMLSATNDNIALAKKLISN